MQLQELAQQYVCQKRHLRELTQAASKERKKLKALEGELLTYMMHDQLESVSADTETIVRARQLKLQKKT